MDTSIRQAPAFFMGKEAEARPDRRILAAMPNCGS
jgi:hypothetical protein